MSREKIITEIEAVLKNIYGKISRNEKDTLVKKAVSLLPKKISENNRKDIIVSAVLDAIDAVDGDSMAGEDDYSNQSTIYVHASHNNYLTWDDISKALQDEDEVMIDINTKTAGFERKRKDYTETREFDADLAKERMAEEEFSNYQSGYNDFKDSDYNEGSRSYTYGSPDPETFDDDDKAFPIGHDVRKLKPGNQLDEAAKVWPNRSREDFSLGR